MADNFNDPFATNLVGLWDFLNGNPNGDTGTADNLTQDGTPEGGANISGGRLHLDGHGDYFDVDGDHGGPEESVFDLTEGTISVQFTQEEHVGSSNDTLVNRGEYKDRDDEGWFAIQVTKYGQIELFHNTGDEHIKLKTAKDLLSPHDNVKVTYSWDETTGVTLTVENLTTGVTETVTSDQTGLTLDIGDNDDEIFTFGAREKDDGDYDQFFKGSIDYVAVYDRDIQNAVPDGVVDGEEFGEVMGLGYDDSNAPTNQGGDKITNDADIILGNGGDDTSDGADGDDTIFGDDGVCGAVVGRESFNWEGTSEHDIDNGFTQDTGSVTVTYARIKDTGEHSSTLGTDDLNVTGIDTGGETIDTDSGLRSVTNGEGNEGDFQWEFSDPVANVEFNINDIDGDGLVTVTAFDADGNEIPVQLVGGPNLTVTGNTADSNGGYDDADTDGYNLQVTIPGPVSKIVVEHDQDDDDNSGVFVTDIYFDVIDPDASGEGGDDVITGGAGADAMFGEGGDDTFIVDDVADADGDTVVGGNGPDDETDNDVLDLRGTGQVTIVATDDGSDDGAQSGTVTFEDGSVLTFSQIETILTDPQNEAPTANDDDIEVDEDGSVTFDPTANDVDPDGDPLEVDSFTQPDNGTVTQNPDGTLTYTPDPDYNGPDSFEVTITDPNGETSTSTVNVNVAPVNDAPDAVNDVAETDEETTVTIDVLENDMDVDGDDLTITAASVPSEQGTVDIVNNELVYTPAEDFFGEATISYSITDGNGGTDVAEVTVTVNNVNDDPVAVDDIAETDEDTPVTIDVLDNDEDADGDDLTILDASVPAEEGTVEIIDNELVFTPAENFNGPATITYTVDDGNGGTDEGTATVNVGAVNDGPTANDDTETTDEDTPVTIDVLVNDEDPDGDAL